MLLANKLLKTVFVFVWIVIHISYAQNPRFVLGDPSAPETDGKKETYKVLKTNQKYIYNFSVKPSSYYGKLDKLIISFFTHSSITLPQKLKCKLSYKTFPVIGGEAIEEIIVLLDTSIVIKEKKLLLLY